MPGPGPEPGRRGPGLRERSIPVPARRRRLRVAVRVRDLLCGLLLLLGAAGPALAGSDGDFRVVVSIKPVHAIVAALLKGITEPVLLVGRGRVPTGYRLSPAQRRQVARADLLVWVGPELERFLAQPAASLPKARVFTLLDDPAIKVLPSRWNDRERDPYFWLDTRNILILIDELTQRFIDRDPARAHLYLRNRERIRDQVAALDRRLEYGYRALKGGTVLNYYDTLQYFEQAYALRVGASLSPGPGTPVAAARLLQARARLADGDYACVLREAGLPADDWSLLMDGVKVRSAEIDVFGVHLPPGEGLYLALMAQLTRAIEDCLGQHAPALEAAVEPMPAQIPEGIGGRFVLIDQNGRLVDRERMLGKFQLIYFGYTHCPDICPTSLQVMHAALERLPPGLRRRIQPYFITVDPERDTQEVMAKYVPYFGKDLIGLTGTRAMIDRVLQQFKVQVQKVPDPGGDPHKYLINHTAGIYLMAPDGRFVTRFASGISPARLARELEAYLR
ncbi:MAG: hypothetical protein D6721_05695 [Gammaproteobacteria bacterium]|nr:MAG: hypothetical protein D6721_05695 [Gammaproteobacteria bacterium]